MYFFLGFNQINYIKKNINTVGLKTRESECDLTRQSSQKNLQRGECCHQQDEQTEGEDFANEPSAQTQWDV